ncbi:rod shape-determining protein MreD [Salirhabdus sp. Marseille-P4669]|uniref:rod shape-determining protein MreD n=1 Tax=Salirhabdus sp. Marseille-P4669 TaxID=2042310 RepID=UPI000C7B40BB|nr:rod shape-determining protein MreD [Salirhabdus sp. Marseille-P4669]
MKRLFIPLFLLILLVLESTAINVLPTEWIYSKNFIIPHWTLVFAILVAIFYDRDHTYFCVLYAIIFGFLIDLTYTNILGVYMFSYGLVVYLIHELKQLFHPNIIVTFLLTILGIFLAEHFIYGLYFMIGVTNLSWTSYLSTRFIPTLLGNVLFLIILYPIIKGKLLKWSEEQLPEK